MKNIVKNILITIGILAGYQNISAKSIPELQKTLNKNIFQTEQTTHKLHNLLNTQLNNQNILDVSHLDSLAFSNLYELQLFQEIIKQNTFITTSFIDRNAFEKLSGNFLVKKSNKKTEYVLYIPKDLKVGELAEFILKINSLIYNNNIPQNAFSNILKKDIEAIIKYLHSITSEENKKEIDLAISKYYKILEDNYSTNSIDTLGTYQNKWEIEIENNMKTFNAMDMKTSLEKTDQLISDAIYRNLFLSLFEYGADTLSEIGGLEKIINIKQLQINLTQTRKNNSTTLLAKTEKETLNKILLGIDQLHLKEGLSTNIDSLLASSSPKQIIENKKILCIGEAILLHGILEKLGIRHYGAELMGHSAIIVELADGQEYYIDIDKTGSTATKMTKIKNYGIREQMKIGNDTALLIKGEPEKILLSQQIGNIANTYILEDTTQVKYNIFFMEQMIKLSPNLPFAYYTLSDLYFKTGNYQEALKYINNALSLDPNYSLSRWLKMEICKKLNDYVGFNEASSAYERTKKMKITYKNFSDSHKRKQIK